MSVIGDNWEVLVYDDEAEICDQLKRFLEEESLDGKSQRVNVTTKTNYLEALTVLEQKWIDLVILDVRGTESAERLRVDDLAGEAGNLAMAEVRKRRFVPVVFYTGLPHQVEAARSSVVHIVGKDAGLGDLLTHVQEIFKGGTPEINRALHRHLREVVRDYMWTAAESWPGIHDTPHKPELAHLLARRVAMSLSGPHINNLIEALGGSAGVAEDDVVHPMHFYVIPPVSKAFLMGDLFYEVVDGVKNYYVLLTNSCDLKEYEKKDKDGQIKRERKAEYALMASCDHLDAQAEYKAWSENRADSKAHDKLREVIGNNRKTGQADRYMFLPGALNVPDMIVDFQKVKTRPIVELAGLARIAAIDSPYAESLASRFTRYYSRIGTPNLDQNVVVNRLQSRTSP